jgi:hypothetical protein
MKREFVINRQGKDYVLYAGLLDVAHQQGLRAIKTQLVQAPGPENGHVAICLAEVTTERGTFTGIGDADPGNVSRMMANALIRMAETRAKARALRDAVNVGMVALEELAEGHADSAGEENAVSARTHAGNTLPPEILSFPGGRSGPMAMPAPAAPVPAAAPEEVASARPPAPAEPAELVASRAAGESTRPTGPAGAAGRAAARGAAGRAAEPPPAPLPPTQTQLETIAKLARSTGRTVPTEGLTRAAASELITRLSEERYGARRPSS